MSTPIVPGNEYHPFYATYIQKIDPKFTIEEGLQNALEDFLDTINPLTDKELMHRYAEGKWSIKEIISHLADGERIFCARALRIARNDKTDLPGFDENLLAKESGADFRDKSSLVEEFFAIRQASILLFKSLSSEHLLRCGTIGGNTISVRALGYIMIGHQLHHLQVIKDRYLNQLSK